MRRNYRFSQAIVRLASLLIGNLAKESGADDNEHLELAIKRLAELDSSLHKLIGTLSDAEQRDPLRRTTLNRLASTAIDDQEVHNALIAFVESG